MSWNKGFCSFALDSGHEKFDVWTRVVFQCCVLFTYVYVRMLNTRQWTSLRVLSTPYVLCVGRKNAALEINPKTRFKRRTTHDAPNLMQMSLNKRLSFPLILVHVKLDVWNRPKKPYLFVYLYDEGGTSCSSQTSLRASILDNVQIHPSISDETNQESHSMKLWFGLDSTSAILGIL